MKIALWKLGSLEHKLVPKKETIEALQELLNSATVNPNTGMIDIIWGPDIEVTVIDVEDNVVLHG